jgi:hypothetical protein
MIVFRTNGLQQARGVGEIAEHERLKAAFGSEDCLSRIAASSAAERRFEALGMLSFLTHPWPVAGRLFWRLDGEESGLLSGGLRRGYRGVAQ